MATIDTSLLAIAIANQHLTPERIAHGTVTVRVSKRMGYDIRSQQSPLEYYYRRHMFGKDDEGYERFSSGRKLYRDWYVSGQSPILTIDFDRIRSTDKRQFLPSTEKQREALDSYRAAMKSVRGCIGVQMIQKVCIDEKDLTEINNTPYGRTYETLIPRFIEALDDLRGHYFPLVRSDG
jgi:hypothetical protein